MKRSAVLGLAALFLWPTSPAAGGNGAASPNLATAATCGRVAVPVGGSAGLQMVGDLCTPVAAPAGRPLLVTVSGATYGRVYWDFPVDPDVYSFVRTFTRHGYPVLNIDRLGVGDSSRPPGASMTVDLGARALHDVADAARTGTLGRRYEQVILVAHSMGSGIAETEAARYGGVDGLVVSGLLHNLNEVGVAAAAATFYPAPADTRFRGHDALVGYSTTLPGTRGASFYHLANADPAVVAADEATKETISTGEMSTLGPFITPGLLAGGGRCPAPDPVCPAQPDLFFGPTPAIPVPVLLVVGDHDGLMCGGTGTDCSSAASVTASEQGHWTGTRCLHVDVIADAGHDLNLHRNAPSFYEVVRNWLGSFERHPGRCPG